MIITVTANPAVDAVYGLGGGLAVGGLNRAKASAIFAGGKGINVSRAVIAEGGSENVRTFCLVGGYVGHLLCDKLSGEGIAVCGIPTECETRMNVCAVSPDGDACEINAPGGPVTMAELDALADAVLDAASVGDTVILAGSVPAVSDGDGTKYWASLIPRLKGKGCTVVLDCSGKALWEAVFGENPPDFIKPNFDELCELFDIDQEMLFEPFEPVPDPVETLFEAAEDASRTAAGHGVSVLATLGSHGSVFTSAENPSEHIRQMPVPVSRVSNIKGAGDTFLGVFVHRYFVEKNDIKSSLAAAAQAAADHVAGK